MITTAFLFNGGVADPSNYFDVVGKPLKDEKGDIVIDELTDYVLNVYYVLLTRAINKLYVYFKDKKSRKNYLNKDWEFDHINNQKAFEN